MVEMYTLKNLRLWDVDTDKIKEMLKDFIGNWEISRNSDLNEFFLSEPKYHAADEKTKEAASIILTYAKNLMDDPNAKVDFYQNKIWTLSSGENVRLRHVDERQISTMMKQIMEFR